MIKALFTKKTKADEYDVALEQANEALKSRMTRILTKTPNLALVPSTPQAGPASAPLDPGAAMAAA